MTGTNENSTPTRAPGLNGWVEAALFVVSISLLNIVYTSASQNDVHVLVFVAQAMFVASIAMLAYTGLGDDWRKVVMHPTSWLFGISAVALETTYFMLLSYLAPAEATLTVRLTVPISVFIGWLFFSRRIDWLMLLGLAIIIAAVLPIFDGLEPGATLPALFFGILCSTVVSIKTFCSEFHPWNRRAKTITEKMRVTGLVVLTTTIALTTFMFVGVGLIANNVISQTSMLPTVPQLTHHHAIYLSIFFGAPLLVAMNYLTFSSVVKIRTENFLAMSAFTPLIAWICQVLAEKAGFISTPLMGWRLLPLTAVGIIGVFIVIWAGRGQGEQD
ncbi:MAG: EamA family transporter [Hyphomicrobiaceae bacterium]